MRLLAFTMVLLAAALVVGAPVANAGEVYNCKYANVGDGPEKDYDFAKRDVDKRDVAKLQTALHKAGYKSGPIDGVYGPITTKAVRAYQADRNMSGDGKLTSDTLRALKITSWCGYDHKLHRNYN